MVRNHLPAQVVKGLKCAGICARGNLERGTLRRWLCWSNTADLTSRRGKGWPRTSSRPLLDLFSLNTRGSTRASIDPTGCTYIDGRVACHLQVKKRRATCRSLQTDHRRHRAVIDIELSRRVVRIVTPRRSRASLLLAGSRETCDIEGEDFTVDKIPNTRCFNCLCKVNEGDWSPSFFLVEFVSAAVI